MKLNKEQIVKDLKTCLYTLLWSVTIIGFIAGLVFKPNIFIPIILIIIAIPTLVVIYAIIKARYIIDE